MSLEIKAYEFEPFVIDLSDRTLYRDRQRVDVSIKAFEVLRVLFENRPHVVEKKELLEAVWPDSFVEEGSLTFTVSQLRKALEDPKTNSKIIETVHRRGYRFVAEASVISGGEATSSSHQTRSWTRWAAAAMVLLVVMAIGAFMLAGRGRSEPLILTGPISIEKLSTSGKVAHAVISRDGKYVVYTNGTGREQQSLWLRQVDSGSTVEIIKPGDQQYLGLALSPDGNFVYFARTTSPTDLTIYRFSIFGGIPAKIAEGAQGWMSISPDGGLISFVRCRYQSDDNCSLYVADALDGANERKLVTYADPIRIGDNEFSPDGRSIAYAYGQSNAGEDNFRLAEVEVAGGTKRDLSDHKFFNIKAIVWLPNNKGWLITASNNIEPDTPIIHLPADGGPPTKLINDSETYGGLSAASTFGALVTTRSRRDTTLYLVDTEGQQEYDLGRPASSVTISRNNRVYFSSARSGNWEIWSANTDGSDQQQLTNHLGIDFVPLVSADNKTIFFSSSRSGEPQIWRMNADGSDQRRVTSVHGGWPIFATRDGSWVYYRHWARGSLWRVSPATGEETELLARGSSRFSVSPDGATVLLNSSERLAPSIELIDLAKGELVKTFELPEKGSRVVEHAWAGDGQAFFFVIVLSDGTKQVWRQERGGGSARLMKKLTRADPVHFFALAPDGKRFAVIQGDWQHDAALIKTSSK
jgi:Tol biopolymer transport system component/DNA-binding winged helix-turn-helix (wHTH) protein